MKSILWGLSLVLGLSSSSFAQSVTVGPLGSGADYVNLTEALEATSASLSSPDVITFIHDGPYQEPARIIVNQDYALDQFGTWTPLTIKANPGIRPRIAVTAPGAPSAFYIRKVGEISVSDLVIMPGLTGTPPSHGVVVDDHPPYATSCTLQNLLITSNDGTNQPEASFDGLTSPTYTASTVSFRQDGVNVSSMDQNYVEHVYFYDVIVSAIPGASNANPCGFRGFPDGAPGSQWVIGPGCVVSYLNTMDAVPPSQTTYAAAALQPGDNRDMTMQVRGTQDKPVLIINNNIHGIGITNGSTSFADGISDVEWCIFANNGGWGYTSGDSHAGTNFKNVTFANHQSGLIAAHTSPDAIELEFSNVIAAGNGNAAAPSNVIRLIATGLVGFGSTFTASDSAIVVNGSYTLNNVDFGGDGIDSDANWNVVKTNVTTADPQFDSLDPTDPGFAVVTNQTYATAGPGGQPLVGGGSIAASSVEDWQLF